MGASSPAGSDVEAPALAAVRGVLARLTAAEPLLGEDLVAAVRAKQAEIEELIARPSFGLALIGDDRRARAALLAELCGTAILAPEGQDQAGPRVRVRRGPTMDYRARLRDGRTLEFTQLHPDRSSALGGGFVGLKSALAERRRARSASEAEARSLERELTDAQSALAAAEHEVTATAAAAAAAEAEARKVHEAHDGVARALAARRALVPRYALAPPPWWAVWGWLLRLLFRRRYHNHAAALLGLEGRVGALARQRDAGADAAAGASDAYAKALQRREALIAAQEAAERRLALCREMQARQATEIAELEEDLARIESKGAARVAERRAQFEAELTALTDAAGRGAELEELVVELPAAPEGVVIVDMATRGNALDLSRGWQALAAEADGCVLAGGGELPREARALFGRALELPRQPARALPTLLRRARLVRVLRLAEDARLRGVAAAADVGHRAEERLRRRIEAVDARRVGNMDVFIATRLDRLGTVVAERARQAIERGSELLDGELAHVAERWGGELRAARGLPELRSVATRLEAEAPATLAAAAARVRQGFAASLAEGAEELATSVLRSLTEESTAGATEPPPLEPDPALAPALWTAPRLALAPALSWTARVRSLARVIEDCVAAMEATLLKLRQPGAAELLAAEPHAREALKKGARAIAAEAIAERERRLDAEADEARKRAARDPVRDAEAELRRDLAALGQELSRATARLETRPVTSPTL